MLPVAMERGQLLLLGERFLGSGGGAGFGVMDDDVLFVDPEAAQTPGGIGHFLDTEGFHVVLGLVVEEERLEDLIEGGLVFGGEAGGGGGETEGEGVENGLVFGSLGLSAVAAGGFDLSGRGVTRHRSSLDFNLALRSSETGRRQRLSYCGI